MFGTGGILIGLIIMVGLVFASGVDSYANFFLYQFLPMILTTLAIVAIVLGLLLLIYG